ncbi:MAG: hypothetical protein JEZ03_09680 [Bacteroidales bacterium]|nr:hypothetical protein [Bacteroidales bacterium]
MKKLSIAILSITILSIPFACKKKEVEEDITPVPSTEIIIADQTKVMDQATKKSIASIDTTNFTFSFEGQTELLNNLKIGDILVDSASEMAPYGYLREVVKIEGTKAAKTVQTKQAQLTQAIPQGNIHFHTGSLTQDKIRKIELAKGVTLKQLKDTDFTVFDFDYEMEFGPSDHKVMVEGNTSLSMDLFFDFIWSFQLLPHPDVIVDLFETGIELNQTASINISSEQSFSANSGDVSLATFYFDPWTFMVGPVPVVFVPKVEVTAVFTTGASESFTGRLGSQYTSDNGWSTISEKTPHWDYYPPEMDVSANVTANVGPKVSLKLYNVMGPYTKVTACLELDAVTVDETDNWNLDYNIGAEATVGVEIDILFFEEDWHESFRFFNQNLMHLENEPMGNGIFFVNPVDQNLYSQGNNILLKASVIGATPTSVEFLVDDISLASLSQEPYEYSWDTESYALGNHTLTVNNIINGQIISSDNITVNLVESKWEPIDLSNFGQSAETINYDVFFSDTDNGWLCGGSGYGIDGYLLHSTNGGQSWEQQSPDYFLMTMQEILYVNENELLIRMFGGSVFSTTDWDREFGYFDIEGNYHVTFSDYTIISLAMSSSGDVTAIGRHYNEDHYSIVTANPANHYFTGSTTIPEYYEYTNTSPEVCFTNDKGIIYNIKDQNNALGQYIQISDNGGVSWETKQLNASGITREDNVLDAFFLNETHGWLVGRENQGFAFVLITQDGGNSWQKVEVPEAYNFGGVHFIDYNEGYATVDMMDLGDYPNYKLFHTLDGGITWQAIEMVYTKLPMKNVNFIGPYLGYAVGQGAVTHRFSVNN